MNPENPHFRLEQKLRQQEAQTQNTAEHRTFASVEDLIRYDASQVNPPASVEARLKESIAAEPPSSTSWWRRLFKRR